MTLRPDELVDLTPLEVRQAQQFAAAPKGLI
jgi:hypothetical protein